MRRKCHKGGDGTSNPDSELVSHSHSGASIFRIYSLIKCKRHLIQPLTVMLQYKILDMIFPG